MTKSANTFTCIKTEGSILPSDLLSKIAAGHTDIDGLKETDYFLVEGEKLSEAISRSWARLIPLWEIFNKELVKLPENDPAIGLTRSKWLLPLFQELGYGQLQRSNVTVIDGKEYPISHFYDRTPIHLVGSGLSIDKRSRGVAGAARISPHGLVQEFLNRTDYLWAFVSNGLYLRILRDNVSLTRQAYVEFDLKAIMDGQVYSDFSLLWLLCHSSRITIPEGKTSEDCWLEKWSKNAIQQGTRVMEDLRVGVEKAIACLGSGFLVCRNNNALREKLRAGQLDKQDYYRQLLRIVYRLIFLFVAEDRDLLLLPDTPKEIKETYLKYYSTRKLRNLAQKHKGTQHCDLWHSLRLIFAKLHKQGCPELGLPTLGSFLWNPQFTEDLNDCDLTNRDFLEAIRSLAYTIDNNSLRQIDYKNLGSEELGSVYESLLELHPQLHIQTAGFELKAAAGHERKTTGSYYTPTSLITCLLDSALNPVIDAAAKKENPEKAILNLKVCDPACGSGHFLVAAAHRIAKRLASVRCGEEEPSPEDTRKALRDVISHCIYGVDINPMSVELCKISLWLEAIEPGKALSFLDHHIKCGNSLLGTNPALMAKGIPDEAFEPIDGDIKQICAAYKRQNKEERKKGQKFMLFDDGKEYPWDKLGSLSTAYNQIEEFSDDTITSQEEKQKRYEDFVKSSSYEFGHQLADSWCAAFVIEKSKKFSYVITENIFREIERKPFELAPWLKEETKRLSRQYKFFHWYLEFPSVFKVPGKNEKPENEQTGLSGGFDCVLGNPPWETWEFKTQDFFQATYPYIAAISNTSVRNQEIENLATKDAETYKKFQEKKYEYYATKRLMQNSGLYILSNQGKINLYSKFIELNQNILKTQYFGLGLVVPGDIATGFDSSELFRHFVQTGKLASLFHFNNKKAIFNIHRDMKFVLLTLSDFFNTMAFIFNALDLHEVKNDLKVICLTRDDLFLINPNTKNCPIFNSKQDSEIIKLIYGKHSIVKKIDRDNLWEINNHRMVNASDEAKNLFLICDMVSKGATFSSDSLITEDGSIFYPTYESKLIWQYDHRFATYKNVPSEKIKASQPEYVDDELKHDQKYLIEMRDYIKAEYADQKWLSKYTRNWFLIYRNVTGIGNIRTTVAAFVPKRPIALSAYILDFDTTISMNDICLFCGNINAFIFDYVSRQKIGGSHLSVYVFDQLPIISPERDNEFRSLISNAVLELSYTSDILDEFARDCGYDGPPFVWDEERRFKIRAELDAAYFHLYLGTEEDWKKTGTKELLAYFPTPKDAVEYIMETFPIVKRKDEKVYGSYRTKELILEVYDKMAESIRTGTAYQTILEVPPGPPCDTHGNFIQMSQWDTANWPVHIHKSKEVAKTILVRSEVQINPTEQIACAMVILDVLALLHTWNKAIDRRVFELGMLLMQKEGLRARVLNRQVISKAPQAKSHPQFINFDEFLGELLGTNSIVVETHRERQFISLGSKAINKVRIESDEKGKQAFKRAEETVKAIEMLKETDYTLDIYCGVEDYGTIEFVLP